MRRRRVLDYKISKLQNYKILSRPCPHLINHDTEHENQVDPECPEEKHLDPGEFAAWAVVFRLFEAELIGFQRSHHCVEVFAAYVSCGSVIKLFFHLPTSYGREH